MKTTVSEESAGARSHANTVSVDTTALLRCTCADSPHRHLLRRNRRVETLLCRSSQNSHVLVLAQGKSCAFPSWQDFHLTAARSVQEYAWGGVKRSGAQERLALEGVALQGKW